MSDGEHHAVTEPRPALPAFAALDLGTNNCRLLVGTPAGKGFRVLDSYSRIVRLGEGLQRTGLLSADAMDRAMAALHGCAARIARRPVRAVRAIATEACRRAANGDAFLSRVRSETGLPIAVISAREEIDLAMESCLPLLRQGGRRALLFDIGGGSTEFAWVRLAPADRPELIGTLSLPLGVVTLAERFGSTGDEAGAFEAMQDHVLQALSPFERLYCIGHEISQGGVRFLGTSGTVTTLAGIALDLPRYSRQAVDGTVLSQESAAAAVRHLRLLGSSGMAAHPCIGPERADFVLPGCAIFAAIQALWPIPEIVVADRGLREGMLLRLMRGDRRRGHRAPQYGRFGAGEG